MIFELWGRHNLFFGGAMKSFILSLIATSVLFFGFANSSVHADESAIPMKIKGVSGPTLAANGFPFTYNLWVQTDIPLVEFVKRVSFVASYSSETQTLNAHQALIVFPYSENEGLLQILFIVPEDQEKGTYRFSGELSYSSADGKLKETISLPLDVVEIGGRRQF